MSNIINHGESNVQWHISILGSHLSVLGISLWKGKVALSRINNTMKQLRTNILNNIVASFMVHLYGVYYNYEPMRVAWRKALKIIWNVRKQTHCRLIALLSDSAPLAVQLKARFVTFMCKTLEDDNPVVKYVAKVSCLNPMSVSGRNWLDCVKIQGGGWELPYPTPK